VAASVGREGARGDDDHRRDGSRAHDVAGLVEHLDPQLVAVHAAQRQQADHDRRERPDGDRVVLDAGGIGPDEGSRDGQQEHESVRGDRRDRPAATLEHVAPPGAPLRELVSGSTKRPLERLRLRRHSHGRRSYFVADSTSTGQGIT
jgi:hypothetical protein